MPRGYRLLILALVGLALIGAAPREQRGDQPQSDQSHQSSDTQLDRIASAVEKLPISPTPDRGCNPGRDDRQSDLCAQWKAADAAAESAWWASATFWLGLVGLIVGSGTLFAAWRAAHWAKKAAEHTESSALEARRGADEAEKSANAAFKSLELAKAANELSSELARPWVSIRCEMDKCRIFDNTALIDGRLIFENLGESPAEGICCYHQVFVSSDTFVNELMAFFDSVRKSAASGNDSLMPGEKLVMHFREDVEIAAFDCIYDEGVKGVQILVGAAAIYRSKRVKFTWAGLRTAKCFYIMSRNTQGGWDRGFSQFFEEAGADDLSTEPFRVGEVS